MSNLMLRDLMHQLEPAKQVLEASQILFNQDDYVKKFFCVTKGMLRFVRNTVDGTQSILHESTAGNTIAVASLFSEKYQCTAISVVDSEIIMCNKIDMLIALKNNPDAMFDLLTSISRQVKDLRTLCEIKNIGSARERLISYFRVVASETDEINLEPSMKDVARKIGIAHETFYRELRCLEKESLIVRKGRKITFKTRPV